MTFTIFWASKSYEEHEVKTFNTLEEVKAFSEEQGHEVILNFEEMELWVYDTYME